MKTTDYFKSTTFFYNNFILKKILDNKLSLEEFVLLVYFTNLHVDKLDIKDVQKKTFLSEKQIYSAYNGLIEKKIVSLEVVDDNGKIDEIISLDNFINEIDTDAKKSNNNSDFDLIVSSFEKYSKVKVSDADKLVFTTWLENGHLVNEILDAFERAHYNGIFSLRYIDKYLNEGSKHESSGLMINKELDEEDWLNE